MSKVFYHSSDTVNYSLVSIIALVISRALIFVSPLKFMSHYFAVCCFSNEYFISSNLFKSLLIFSPPTHIFLLLPPSLPFCFFFPPPLVSASLLSSSSRDSGLLMTSLRFVSQLALTAVDYLTISIQRQRHLRDSPTLSQPSPFSRVAQIPCDVTHT